jgi:thiosulfate reductase cytochrome b subunit
VARRLHGSIDVNADERDADWMERHSLSVRICHWVLVVCFSFLLVSGAHIFLDFPELYWGQVGYQGIEPAFRLADWGLSWDEAGDLGDRRWGRNVHFASAWALVLNGLVYFGWNLWRGSYRRKLLPARSELTAAHLKRDIVDHLRFKAPAGAAALRYNTLQKLSYLLILFVLFPFMLATGLAQMPAFNAISPGLIDLFGGRQTARTLHVIATVLLVSFVVIHVVEVFVAGAVKEIRSMITGRYVLPRRSEK